MTKTSSTTISCRLPIPSCEYTVLQVISQLVDEEVTFENVAGAMDMHISSYNTFTQKKTVVSSISLIGIVRSLTTRQAGGELWDAKGLVESWINAAVTSLLPILKGDQSNAILLQTLKDFLANLDGYLFEHDQTYLVGDAATAADVCVAIPLAMLATSDAFIDSLKFPQQAFRWMQTILSQIASVAKVKSINWEEWKAKLLEGPASPLEKPKPVEAEPQVESPAPAPAKSEAPAAPAAPAPAPAPEASSSDDGKNPIIDKLGKFSIEFTQYDHTLATTAEELVEKVALPDGETHTKNLFFKDKKHGLFLVSVTANSTHTTPIQTKELGKLMGLQGKTNLRLADEKLLMEKLQAKPGCVGPLCAAMHVSTGEKDKITVVLDEKLLSYKKIHSHPLRNDMSVVLTPDALKDYLTKAGIEPMVIDFSSDSAAAPAPAPSSAPPASKAPPKEKKPKQPSSGQQQKKTAKKGETLLSLQWSKEENFPGWYSDVIVLSEMIAYYDISGCYILRPWSYKMWELIQDWFNKEIYELGVENSYFPLFVSRERLEKEKDHVEGFAPEVAWVTKSGDGDLAVPIAIRPTSETIMYPAFADWIQSHRDLPLKLNQWSNVVRWEFKDPTPFLRSREFLWQEGHTVHATFEDADVMVMQALELYRQIYEDLMAVPVIKGRKTEKEKFAGGFMTTTVEAYIHSSGRAIQGATSHNLGQNFGKMFDIKFQDKSGKSQIAWQTSWGFTTRSIGVMVMVHGDDAGLVLPPRMAPIQVVIVPILSKTLTMETAGPYCDKILKEMKAAGIRCKFDDREIYNPGWKYNHWEQKGTPIRIEVGPRDIDQNQVRLAIRHNGEKKDVSIDGLAAVVKSELDEIQKAMFEKAKAARDDHVVQVTEWKDFVPNLELNNLVLTPWCGGEHQDWEDWVKTTSREESLKARGEGEEDERAATSVAAKTLCMPFDQPPLPEGTKCIASGLPATCWVLWGRSY